MKILISSEVTEEIADILSLINPTNKYKHELCLVTNNNTSLPSGYSVSFSIYKENRLFNNRILQKVYGLLYFFFVLIFEKPDCIFSGFSMFKHRLASKLLGIRHLAYFRGLMFNSQNISGISDNLRHGSFKWLFKSKIFNTYEADKIFTVGELNMNFIEERNVSKRKIYLVGPIWLGEINIQKCKTSEIKVIFLTQAFCEHGFQKQHEDQIDFLKSLINWCKTNKAKLIVRVHPRDYYDYANLNANSDYEIDKSKPTEFLRLLNYEDIVITPLSTMAFEIISIGGKCIFYTSREIDQLYKRAYDNLSIVPIEKRELTDNKDLQNNIFNDCGYVFSKINKCINY